MRTEVEPIHPWRWRLLYAWIIIFSIAVGWSIRDGRLRDNEIQHSRLVSCQRTYNGIREVFKPFFPPQGKRSAKQKSDLEKFNATVNHLVHRCKSQVKGGVH